MLHRPGSVEIKSGSTRALYDLLSIICRSKSADVSVHLGDRYQSANTSLTPTKYRLKVKVLPSHPLGIHQSFLQGLKLDFIRSNPTR